MEIASKPYSFDGLKEKFLKEPKPFTSKRDIHWKKLG